MKNWIWTKSLNKNIGHREIFSVIDNKNRTVPVISIGQYKDDHKFQVSLQGKLNFLYNTDKDFDSLEEIKNYVEEIFSSWILKFK